MPKPTKTRDIQVPIEMVENLLTDSEYRMVKQRYQILNLLQAGQSIRNVSAKMGVGTDTVVRAIRLAENKGIIKNIRLPRKKSEPPQITSSNTAWIFGKSE